LSVPGAFAHEGIKGLGFRFVQDERWAVPNPVGLDGHYEGLCPPYYKDMRAALHTFVDRKFGLGGAYDSNVPGPWKHSRDVKRSLLPYSAELMDCMGETAQYIYETYGRFPATVPTIVLAGFVQAQHLDTEYYDTHFAPGAYLDTHASHMPRWHGDGAG
jgi:hypothetical protein